MKTLSSHWLRNKPRKITLDNILPSITNQPISLIPKITQETKPKPTITTNKTLSATNPEQHHITINALNDTIRNVEELTIPTKHNPFDHYTIKELITLISWQKYLTQPGIEHYEALTYIPTQHIQEVRENLPAHSILVIANYAHNVTAYEKEPFSTKQDFLQWTHELGKHITIPQLQKYNEIGIHTKHYKTLILDKIDPEIYLSINH